MPWAVQGLGVQLCLGLALHSCRCGIVMLHAVVCASACGQTLSEAQELEQGDVGVCQQFALLGAGGRRVHLQPDNPVSDGQLNQEGAG